MTEILESDRLTQLETREQVMRLVSAGALSPDSRSLALLEYLLHHWHTKGPGVPIKAYGIAVDVLGRGADFDPSTDSIVRVEIGRLRKLLAFYYQGPGQGDLIRIGIPRGQIMPEITLLREIAKSGSSPETGPQIVARLGRPYPLMAAVLIGASVAIASIVFLNRDRLFGAPEFPHLAVSAVTNQTVHHDLDFLSSGLENQLITELSHYRSLRVLYGESPQMAYRSAPEYLVRGALNQRGTQIDMAIHLVRTADQSVVWSSISNFSPDDPDLASNVAAALRNIVVQIAAPSGALNAEERNRLATFSRSWKAAAPAAYICYLHWQSFDLTKAPEDETYARNCLKKLTDAGLQNGSIWAAQAFMVFFDWTRSGGGGSDPALEKALAAASRAIALDPTSSETHEAMASILLARGQPDAALESLRRAVEFNPSNPELRVKIGWQQCLSGQWDDGSAQIRNAMAELSSEPGWYRIPLALDAFRQGDFATSLAESRLIAASGDRRGLVLALAAARAQDDAEAEIHFAAELEKIRLTPAAALSEIRAVFDQPMLFTKYQAILAKSDG
ncbi:tetratricopeptide repeat protein [Rhodobacter ferrooxidans]|uniref:Tetratricopeptide TPR_2 repeat protein n=1 Tax=Rhodobacter ferrooxidans TaxID=371731 RepID=C8S416_9RHOB|nr:tetratricopeptide repeat protein [Rhodobacter sp. SW2]EEW24278.1 Tetratricopeptide TPR_2 repeat protein [Rhodobacter sp. SW2]